MRIGRRLRLPLLLFLTKRSMSGFAGGARAARPKVSRDAAGTITVEPAEGQHDSLVIISHGLGDTAAGMQDIGAMFAQRMPRTKFVMPTAPTQPVTLNGGMAMPSWYDITGLDDRANEACHGIVDSAETVRAILDAEHGASGLAYSRMVLAGFSQGGALSLFAGLQQKPEQRLAGILVMSGYLAAASTFSLSKGGVEQTPVLHMHGGADPMVKPSWAQDTKDVLVATGATEYDLRFFPGMQHTVIPEELAQGVEFLEKVLGAEAVDAKDKHDIDTDQAKAAIESAALGKEANRLQPKPEL